MSVAGFSCVMSFYLSQGEQPFILQEIKEETVERGKKGTDIC